ncbi:MAG: ATP-binding protein [Pseudomonadota bacterium]
MHPQLKRRWRPRLWTVVLVVLSLVLCLPIASLILFKFYANQLVQQTEESLLAQGAIMANTYAALYAAETSDAPRVPNVPENTEFDPVLPALSLTTQAIATPRPGARAADRPVSAAHQAIAAPLSQIARQAQAQTLAGYRFLDTNGTVFAGTAEQGLSLRGIEEVDRALAGSLTTVARLRVRDTPEPFIYALSRGTGVRVFVAIPVTISGQTIGAVYLSRTPSHIFHFLYGERWRLAQALGFVVLATLLIGWVFWRFITGPLQALTRQSNRAARDNQRWAPLAHFGTREVEQLSRSFQSLTDQLHRQQEALRSYTAHVTHELKSPLTSIKGAAELLTNTQMTAEQRTRFAQNIARDTGRMEELLTMMRQFTLSEQLVEPGQTKLSEIADSLTQSFQSLTFEFEQSEGSLPLHPRALKIALHHLLENAQYHGATVVRLARSEDASTQRLTVSDNGSGISAGNLDKVLTPFFTTRREQGGTGMGLNIAMVIIEACGGQLTIAQAAVGARIILSFPRSCPAGIDVADAVA